jgi:hypothetical protein
MGLVVVCFLAVSGDQSREVTSFPYDPERNFHEVPFIGATSKQDAAVQTSMQINSCNWNLTVQNGAYLLILLFSFQLSFFLWSTLSLFLMFSFVFVFTSLITHICFSTIENECSALHFLLFKKCTLRPVPDQVPTAKGWRRTPTWGC